MIYFFQEGCLSSSSNRRFGLCDDLSPATNPAYIDEANGENWIATVVNDYEEQVDFYAIDNCVVVTPKGNGTASKRCDGVLVLNDIIAFVELKSRIHKGADWVDEAYIQLRDTILKYENEGVIRSFSKKRGYIANGMKPRARRGQGERIERFSDETSGYVLYVQATINLHSVEG